MECRRGEEGRGKDGREGGNVCDRVCGVVEGEGRGAGFVLVDALAKGVWLCLVYVVFLLPYSTGIAIF